MDTLSKRLTAGLLVVALALAGAVAPALAQDPYGSTTTTTAPAAVLPTCSLSATSGAPGTSVTATVSNVPQGQTVRILFGGDEVGRGTAAGGTSTAVSVAFVVPNRVPGEYLVTAVGATFTVQCGPEAGGTFSVLAATAQRQGGGSLAKTGIYVGLLLVVVAALVLAGRGFVSESKRRRRRVASATGSRSRAGV